jgi:uncharacterized Zn finger protein
MPNAQDIALTSEQFSMLVDAIDALTPAIVSRGAALMRERAVRSVSWIVPLRVIGAKVQGTRLYNTTLTLNDESAATECTCDYGDGCKHGAALILELRKHAVEVKSAKAAASAVSVA